MGRDHPTTHAAPVPRAAGGSAGDRAGQHSALLPAGRRQGYAPFWERLPRETAPLPPELQALRRPAARRAVRRCSSAPTIAARPPPCRPLRSGRRPSRPGRSKRRTSRRSTGWHRLGPRAAHALLLAARSPRQPGHPARGHGRRVAPVEPVTMRFRNQGDDLKAARRGARGARLPATAPDLRLPPFVPGQRAVDRRTGRAPGDPAPETGLRAAPGDRDAQRIAGRPGDALGGHPRGSPGPQSDAPARGQADDLAAKASIRNAPKHYGAEHYVPARSGLRALRRGAQFGPSHHGPNISWSVTRTRLTDCGARLPSRAVRRSRSTVRI